jgi:hypothetical protein
VPFNVTLLSTSAVQNGGITVYIRIVDWEETTMPENFDHSASEIYGQLEKGNISSVQQLLAEEYLTTGFSNFKQTIQEMEGISKRSSSDDIYANGSSKSPFEVYVNDGFFRDTRLAQIQERAKPNSPALEDDGLEQVARRYNDLLSNSYTRQEATAVAATKALLRYAQSLPPERMMKLLNRAEDINMDFTPMPALRVALGDLDGDGKPFELRHVDLTVMDTCSEGDHHWPRSVHIYSAK